MDGEDQMKLSFMHIVNTHVKVHGSMRLASCKTFYQVLCVLYMNYALATHRKFVLCVICGQQCVGSDKFEFCGIFWCVVMSNN
jgi:hypothetical protein